MLNPNASAFAYASKKSPSPLSNAVERLNNCQISPKNLKIISPLLTEWFSSSTLNNILQKWENHNESERIVKNRQSVPTTFILYNVQGLNSRGLEVIELIHRTEA
jgi:hypothetical protein